MYRMFIISKTFIIFPRQILPGLLLQSIISRTFIFSKIAPQRTLIINNPIIQDTRVNYFNHRNWLNACIVKTAIQKRNATLLDSKWYTVVLWWIYLTQGNSIRNPLLNPTLCHQAKRRSSCYAMLVTIISSGKPSRIWLYIYRVSHYRVRHIPNAEKS